MTTCDKCHKRIRGVPWALIRRGPLAIAGKLCAPCHAAWVKAGMPSKV